MSPEGGIRSPANTKRVALLVRARPSAWTTRTSDSRELRKFAATLSENVGEAAPFTCLITDDQEMRRLNRDFLGRDYATDVLSFPGGGGRADLGEIAISFERAKAQAEEFGHSCLDEIRVLMLHGFLHLTGLDHERDGGSMARAEHKWRTAFGLPSTLIARSRIRQGARK